MRTTCDLALPILKELKAFSKSHSFSFGKAVTQLLMEALTMHQANKKKASSTFQWRSQPIRQAKGDLLDKEALYKILDQDELFH